MKDSGAKRPSRGSGPGDDGRESDVESRLSNSESLIEDGALMDASVEPTQALRAPTPEEGPDAADALIVGAPEPEDWVRLPDDPRAAPTLPSLRRRRSFAPRVLAEGELTPAEALVERRRERFQRWIAFGLGSLLAVLTVGVGIVSSRETSDAPAPAVAAAIEPARAASAPPVAAQEEAEIPPPPAPLDDSETHLDESSTTSPTPDGDVDATGSSPGTLAESNRAERVNDEPEAGPAFANPGTRAGQRNKPKNKLWFPPE